ncbi:hypothetical protein [Balneicella halophila]|nr:hypothetical protein [Balneicella halophila]
MRFEAIIGGSTGKELPLRISKTPPRPLKIPTYIISIDAIKM